MARLARALLAALFVVAVLLFGRNLYVPVLAVLTFAAALAAAANQRAAIILIVGVPALGSFGLLSSAPPVSVFQVVLTAALAGFLIRVVRSKVAILPLTILDLGVLTFLVAALASLFFSASVPRSIVGLAEVVAFTGMYMLLSRSLVNPESQRDVLSTVITVGAVSAVIALGQALFAAFPVPILESNPTGYQLLPVRATAMFVNPNTLSLLLVLAGLLSLSRTFDAQGSWKKLGYLVLTLLMVLGITVTFSRQGMLGMLAGVVLAVLVCVPGKTARIGGVVVVTGILALLLAIPGVGERAESIVDFSGDESAMDRVYLTEVSARMFESRPMTGVGIGAFADAYPRYTDPRVHMNPVTDSHQMWVGTAAETGILGLLASILIVGSIALVLTKARALRQMGYPIEGALASTAFVIVSFFNILYYDEPTWIALSLLGALMRSAGIAIIYPRSEKRREEAERVRIAA